MPTPRGYSGRAVELHGGLIGVESEPEKGARFTFTLPLAQHNGCPVGLSLIGWPGAELSLLAFAEAFVGRWEAGAG